uniref:Uncharacterized protein LOC114346528 n=1 Tax=Diabrotica virgifera virgifera TaxID=50390 RepID=A0A6P7H5S2_DIAVI
MHNEKNEEISRAEFPHNKINGSGTQLANKNVLLQVPPLLAAHRISDENTELDVQNQNMSSDKDVARLMKQSINLSPASFLVPWETSTYFCNSNPVTPIYPSDNILNNIVNSNLKDSLNFRTSRNRHMPLSECNTLEDDLLLSESEEDPFASDNDINDPDYSLIKETCSFQNQDLIDNQSLLDGDTQSQSVTSKQLNTRKRQRNPSQWRRNKIKASRNRGEEYADWKGNIRAKKQQKNACTNCRNKCSEKISEEERRHIFESYWQLGDVNRQRDFIANNVDVTEKKRTRLREINEKESDEENHTENEGNKEKTKERKRVFSYKYTFYNRGQKTVVCKSFFLNTLGISAQVVKTVIKKMGSTGIVSEDRRGKVCKNSKLDDSVKQSIRDHINLFQTVESHYYRKNTSKRFLPSTLNIAKMYGLYVEYCEVKNIIAATESMYRIIFNTEFNLSFFIPKKDMCDICNKYTESTTEEKNEIEEEYQTHIRNKEVARQLKHADKEEAKLNSELCAAVFDLEQILPVPKCNIGLTYYKLKLSTYNFTVYNMADGEGYCYMWYESIGKRGCSEIGSCLINFINHKVDRGTKQFSFYSDNCAGQNRNKFLFTMYSFLAQKHNIVIKHTFLEKGHTQTEGDSMHSVIERASKHIPIFSPDQWYTLVRTAKKNNPFHVIEMDKEKFLDLKALTQEITLNWDRDVNNEKVHLNKIRIVEANSKFPNKILFKHDYHEQYKTIDLLQKGRKSINIDINNVELKQLYKDFLPLTKKKHEHLQFLCNKKVIPTQYHNFYAELPYSDLRTDDSD